MFWNKKQTITTTSHIENGDLVTNFTVGKENYHSIVPLKSIFAQYLDYRTEGWNGRVYESDRKDVIITAATLRAIARELELSLDTIAH